MLSPLVFIKGDKKTDKPKKINQKNWTEKKNRLNRLEYLERIPVRFGFGFVRQKPINPNRTELVQKKVL
jgi:hypothetical protein